MLGLAKFISWPLNVSRKAYCKSETVNARIYVHRSWPVARSAVFDVFVANVAMVTINFVFVFVPVIPVPRFLQLY